MRAWEWQNRAACRGMPLGAFFPTPTEDPAPEVKAACGRCPVRGDCLNVAQAMRLEGVWGGLTDAERLAARRRESRARTTAARREEAA